MISKIENGRTIPLLPVLLNIINALEIKVSYFFEGVPKPTGENYIVSRAKDNSIIEKEADAKEFTYQYIFEKQLSSIGFEAVAQSKTQFQKRKSGNGCFGIQIYTCKKKRQQLNADGLS